MLMVRLTDTRKPLSGLVLRKPKVVNLSMLERWDVCYDAHDWLKNTPGLKGFFRLHDGFVEDTFSRYSATVSFKPRWFVVLARHLGDDLMKQTNNKLAHKIIRGQLAVYEAAVIASALRELPIGIRMEENVRLGQMLVKLIQDL
jgi:hypothetical protein